jgi:hypothetical protein
MLAVRIALIFVLASSMPALATPGQTAVQVEAWGKANPSFTEFAKKTSLGGYSTFRAYVSVDGHKGEYSSLIDKTGVYGEYLTFSFDEPDSWAMAGHRPFMHDVVAKVYGADITSDFDEAARVKTDDADRDIFKGNRFAYVTDVNSLIVVRLDILPQILHNLDNCYGVFCSSQ